LVHGIHHLRPGHAVRASTPVGCLVAGDVFD
jgi:hypothetical protein